MVDNNQNKKNASSEAKKSQSSLPEGYRLLGESGLVEDEEGNVFSASELLDPSEREQLAAIDTSYASPPDAGTEKMPDWAAIYDPRYCGPSREAYIDEMTRKYQLKMAGEKQTDSEEKHSPITISDGSRTPDAPSSLAEKSSSFDAKEPSFDAKEPSFDAKEPSFDAKKPSSDAKEPSFDAKEPSFETKKPSSDAKKPSSDVNEPSFDANEPSSDIDGTGSEEKPQFYISKRTLVFYIIGVILLLAYFCILIYRLISLIIHLFEI